MISVISALLIQILDLNHTTHLLCSSSSSISLSRFWQLFSSWRPGLGDKEGEKGENQREGMRGEKDREFQKVEEPEVIDTHKWMKKGLYVQPV